MTKNNKTENVILAARVAKMVSLQMEWYRNPETLSRVYQNKPGHETFWRLIDWILVGHGLKKAVERLVSDIVNRACPRDYALKSGEMVDNHLTREQKTLVRLLPRWYAWQAVVASTRGKWAHMFERKLEREDVEWAVDVLDRINNDEPELLDAGERYASPGWYAEVKDMNLGYFVCIRLATPGEQAHPSRKAAEEWAEDEKSRMFLEIQDKLRSGELQYCQNCNVSYEGDTCPSCGYGY